MSEPDHQRRRHRSDQNPQRILGGGFLTKIAAPGDASATATYADYAGSHAQFDGIHAATEREISSLVAVDVLKHSASVYQTGSGESGSEAMERRSMSCMSSSYIPAATNAGQALNNIYHLSGPNGGAMRGDSIAATWPTLELIRDIYSQASQGVVLTLGGTLGCVRGIPLGRLLASGVQDHVIPWICSPSRSGRRRPISPRP